MKHVFLASLLFLTSCATSHDVNVIPGDKVLSCYQLDNEIAKLDKFVNDKNNEKSISFRDAVKALLFPIVILTYENELIDNSNQRKLYLSKIKQRKGCMK